VYVLYRCKLGESISDVYYSHLQSVVLPKSVTVSRIEENLKCRFQTCFYNYIVIDQVFESHIVFTLPQDLFERIEKAAAEHPPFRSVDPSDNWGYDIFG
jgi:hypothetical protein